MEENNEKTPQEVYSITTFGFTEEVKPAWTTYRVNGTLALQLMCKPAPEDMEFLRAECPDKDELFIEPYGMVTVNLPESDCLPDDEQFVDINNLPGVDRWLVQNGIAEPAGIMARSGYCVYPAYKFNAPKEALEKVAERKAEIALARKPEEKAQGKTHKI